MISLRKKYIYNCKGILLTLRRRWTMLTEITNELCRKRINRDYTIVIAYLYCPEHSFPAYIRKEGLVRKKLKNKISTSTVGFHVRIDEKNGEDDHKKARVFQNIIIIKWWIAHTIIVIKMLSSRETRIFFFYLSRMFAHRLLIR